MKTLTTLLCSLAIATGAALADDHELKPLFNGKDLTGFTTTGNWVVEEDGILAIKPREGEEGWKRYDAYLFTDFKVADFVLELEYKYPEGGNSGVFFRVADMADPVNLGMEVQILDSFGVEKELTHHDNGGIIKTSPPKKNMSLPAGEWNKMKLTVKGDNVKVELNGELIQNVNLSETDSKDKPKSGHISLQDHGQVMYFRNINYKEL